jgi:hypothetical protein
MCLTTLPPSMSFLSRQCEILNISQPYRSPRSVTLTAFLLFNNTLNNIISKSLKEWKYSNRTKLNERERERNGAHKSNVLMSGSPATNPNSDPDYSVFIIIFYLLNLTYPLRCFSYLRGYVYPRLKATDLGWLWNANKVFLFFADQMQKRTNLLQAQYVI